MSDFDPSPARRGLDALLRANPALDVVSVDWGPRSFEDGIDVDAPSPWLLVELGQRSMGVAEVWARHPYAIWKATGSVYGMRGGAVDDDPLIEVEPKGVLCHFERCESPATSHAFVDGGVVFYCEAHRP